MTSKSNGNIKITPQRSEQDTSDTKARKYVTVQDISVFSEIHTNCNNELAWLTFSLCALCNDQNDLVFVIKGSQQY